MRIPRNFVHKHFSLATDGLSKYCKFRDAGDTRSGTECQIFPFH